MNASRDKLVILALRLKISNLFPDLHLHSQIRDILSSRHFYFPLFDKKQPSESIHTSTPAVFHG